MKQIGVRLVEIVAAALLAGLVLLVFNGLTTGLWQPYMLLIVPLGFIWSMYLGTMAIANISMALFLVVGVLLVLAIYLIARFAHGPPVRVAAETVAFLVQQLALIVLFGMLGISA